MSLPLYLGVGAVALTGVATVYYYNKIVKLENRVDNAWAQIDVQLKKRADLVPNLMETVEGYMEHEREIMVNVSESRERMMNASSQEEEVQAGNDMGQALKSFRCSRRLPRPESKPELQNSNKNYPASKTR